jgi:hypothetical protein
MITKNEFNPQCITYSQMRMTFNMRIYFRRIFNLTRIYMRNRYYNLGAPDVLFDRLYLEYLDLGNMLHLNFGRANRDQYSQLLGEFAITLSQLISAQIEGNIEAVNRNVRRIFDNVNARAAFLAELNPYWATDEYRNLSDTYIQYLIRSANALSLGNLNEDIALYDPITELTNKIGDAFAEGIFNYINSGETPPAPEGEACITYEQMRTIQNVGMFWFDLLVWLRNYMLSKFINIGDKEATFDRLKRVVVDFGSEIKNIYGEQFATDIVRKLNEYIDLVDQYTTAQMEGNNEEVNRIIPLLYQNTDARAAMEAAATSLSESEWRSRLRELQVQGIIDESTALLSGDFARSLDIFMTLLSRAENMSEFVAPGLFNYFTQTQRNIQGTDNSVPSC